MSRKREQIPLFHCEEAQLASFWACSAFSFAGYHHLRHSSFSLVIYSEQKAAAVSGLIHELEIPETDNGRWLALSDVSIDEVSSAPRDSR